LIRNYKENVKRLTQNHQKWEEILQVAMEFHDTLRKPEGEENEVADTGEIDPNDMKSYHMEIYDNYEANFNPANALL
jgi:hypothetical protein